MIPEAILTKAPSAELRPNQTDQDSLPPYDVLDDILQRHIERHQPEDEIVAAGFDAATVRARAEDGPRGRVQAQAGRARAQGHRPRVRHRLAHADRRKAEPRHLRGTGRSEVRSAEADGKRSRADSTGPLSRHRRCIHNHSSG